MTTSTGWKTRELAVRLLSEFEKKKELKNLLEKIPKDLNPSDRALIREIVSGSVRYLRLLDFSIEKVSGRKVASQKPEVRNGLRVAAYQIFFTGIPPYAAVNETVEAVKRLAGRKEAGFVNAVSKKLISFNYRKEVEKIEDKFERIAILYSFETWMVRRWAEFYGGELEELLSGLNRVAPLWLRVNRLKTTPEELKGILEKSGITVEEHPFLKDMLRVKGRVLVTEIPGYREGLFYVQDPASYLSAYLLSPKPGEQILDLGAAPGGKTTAIASITEDRAKIVAVDVNPERMELLKENCRRLGIKSVNPVITDIRKDLYFQEQFKETFDRILIDAPCSATGVIRRHPEGKWNKSLSLIRHNQKIQRELIRTSLKLLKPGGYLIYSVCSLEREEGEENLEFALSTGFEVWENETAGKLFPERFKGGGLRLFPHRDNTDGFFYAALKKPH